MPHDTHLVVHGERKEVMGAGEVKAISEGKCSLCSLEVGLIGSINPVKDVNDAAEALILKPSPFQRRKILLM